MKKHVIVSLLMMILTLAPVLNVHAQTDTDGQTQNDGKKGKKEKKKKEKVKKPSKDDLNIMVNQLNSQVKNLEAENERLKTAVTQKEEEIFQLQDELTAEKLKPAPVAVVDPVNVKPEGIAFKVQIGAYQKFNINQYFTETKKISYEDVNGTNKYVIGYFTTLEAAKGFESDMKKMGIKDSWLVPYKDGVRITDEEAESILGQPIRDLKKKK
jgi:uncharacterized protein (UPF0371 family)